MILVWAVIIGLLISLIRYRGEFINHITSIPIRNPWLILIAVALQIPLLRSPTGPTDEFVVQQILFILSHILLLVFIWLNRHTTGVLIIGGGILLNILVILINGGFMPISPETLVRINPGSTNSDWTTGLHYGYSKDIIIEKADTNLQVLSDILIMPIAIPVRAAFSIGDIFIGFGIIYLLNQDQKAMHGK